MILAAAILSGGLLVDRVDIIELNHVYSVSEDKYDERLVQLIFYNVSKSGAYEIVGWRMWNKAGSPLPYKDRGLYCLDFFDGEKLRRIEARAFIRTKSNYDPEIDGRGALPVHKRRGFIDEQPLISIPD